MKTGCHFFRSTFGNNSGDAKASEKILKTKSVHYGWAWLVIKADHAGHALEHGRKGKPDGLQITRNATVRHTDE